MIVANRKKKSQCRTLSVSNCSSSVPLVQRTMSDSSLLAKNSANRPPMIGATPAAMLLTRLTAAM